MFSQNREGEEFVLLAMYVAVNIDNDCFKKYINEKGKANNCNTAFTNMAELLNLSYTATTECIKAFKTALSNVYGEEYVTGFNKIIKTDTITNISAELTNLAKHAKEELEKQDNESKQAFEAKKIAHELEKMHRSRIIRAHKLLLALA